MEQWEMKIRDQIDVLRKKISDHIDWHAETQLDSRIGHLEKAAPWAEYVCNTRDTKTVWKQLDARVKDLEGQMSRKADIPNSQSYLNLSELMRHITALDARLQKLEAAMPDDDSDYKRMLGPMREALGMNPTPVVRAIAERCHADVHSCPCVKETGTRCEDCEKEITRIAQACEEAVKAHMARFKGGVVSFESWETLHAECEKHRRSCVDLRADRDRLQAEVDNLNDALKEAQDGRDEAAAKSAIDERQCDEMTKEAGRLAEENASLKADVERLEKEKETLHKNYRNLKAQLDDNTYARALLQSENARLRTGNPEAVGDAQIAATASEIVSIAGDHLGKIIDQPYIKTTAIDEIVPILRRLARPGKVPSVEEIVAILSVTKSDSGMLLFPGGSSRRVAKAIHALLTGGSDATD